MIESTSIRSFDPLHPLKQRPTIRQQESLRQQLISRGKEVLPSLLLRNSEKGVATQSLNDVHYISSTPSATTRSQETQTALVVNADRTYHIIDSIPVPQVLASHEVLIRTHSVGLNHIDWKSVEYNYCLPAFPWINGREMAGVIVRVGSEVTGLEAGDRVWTSTYYKDRRAGCFQELVVVPQHTVFRIPSSLDFNSAACLGVAGATAAMTLWRWLDVPMPDTSTTAPLSMQGPETNMQSEVADRKETLLIWGASTVTGQFCLQLAVLAGLETIAICSESTARLVTSLGATHVITYTGKTDTHLIDEILSVAQRRLSKAIDAVGAATAKLVLDVIQACGSDHLVDFAPLAFMAKDQTIPSNARVQDVQMKQFILDPTARVYGEKLNELLEAKKLRTPRLRVLYGGIGAIEGGLEMLKRGNLAGEKLIVSFA